MAVVGSGAATLVDLANQKDPNGKQAKIAELLSLNNEIVSDMIWKEGNLSTGNRSTVRTSLPNVYFRRANEGVAPSKSTTAQVDDSCALLEAWSETDVEVANLNGDVSAFRISEASAYMEAMSQKFATTVFYGNAGTAPAEFTGLAPRYNSLSGNAGKNVINGGGSGSDNSSIYLIGWGEQSVHGIYPKGTTGGLTHEDLGIVTVETTNGIGGSRMRAYQDHFIWRCGLTVRDPRYIVRIANIDMSNLRAKSGALDVIEAMIAATYKVPSLKGGKFAFYMNRAVKSALDIQKRDDVVAGGGLMYDKSDGEVVHSFRGIPVRVCDALVETEAVVS